MQPPEPIPLHDRAEIVLDQHLVLDLAHRSIRRGSAVIALSELE
jgi:two-component system response regulator RegX3